MKIFSTEQIRKADAYTIKNEPINSVDLMERASENCFKWIEEHINIRAKKFVFFCGTGNNGGDGLAIARMLSLNKANVTIYIINTGGQKSPDFCINEKRLASVKGVYLKYIYEGDDIENFSPDTVIIDAIFGSGLNKPIEGFIAKIINHINAKSYFTISIDIPSGLFADDNSHNKGAIIKAHVTLSLQFPKLSFLFPEFGINAGKWVIIPIGLHEDFISKEPGKHCFTLKKDILKIIKPRQKFSHKGHFGHALLIGGSYGKIGSIVLSSLACLRTGAGLLTTHIPTCGYDIIQSSVPEAMVCTDKDAHYITEYPNLDRYDAIGIGPGLDKDNRTITALQKLMETYRKPIVLDADAINIISENPGLKNIIPKKSIITPHIKEFERFAGRSFKNDMERFEKQKILSKTHNIYIVLKGAYTCISSPDENAYFNSTGNSGMATAGSGDVLTGIITSLLAQGFEPLDAAKAGVFLHGLAGDFAADDIGSHSLIASDIINYLPKAFLFLESDNI